MTIFEYLAANYKTAPKLIESLKLSTQRKLLENYLTTQELKLIICRFDIVLNHPEKYQDLIKKGLNKIIFIPWSKKCCCLLIIDPNNIIDKPEISIF